MRSTLVSYMHSEKHDDISIYINPKHDSKCKWRRVNVNQRIPIVGTILERLFVFRISREDVMDKEDSFMVQQKRILDDTLPNASQKRLQEKKMSIRTKLVWPKQTSCSWFCTNKIAESQIDESTPMPIELTTSVTRCLQRRLHICDQ